MKIYLQRADLRNAKADWCAIAGPYFTLEEAIDRADYELEQVEMPVWTIRVVAEVPHHDNDARPMIVVLISPMDLIMAMWLRREFNRLRQLLAPAGGA